MIQLQGICKQYGSKVLLEDAEAFIGAQSRVALIGPNGAGKSTLFRMILGQEPADSGRITRSKYLRLGHLAQEVPRHQSGTVLSEVVRLEDEVQKLKDERTSLEEQFSHGLEDPVQLERYGKVLTELERLDEAKREARGKEILMGLGFKPEDFYRSLPEFSGGWLMRVAFARVLLMEPDLLLLDEPTNHLDLESVLWLEGFLRNYSGSILVISHDRAFLNTICNEVLEIDLKRIYQYRGNLTAYAEQKAQRLELLKAQHKNQQAKIEHLQDFIDRFGAKATKARQAQSRVKQLEKMERIELPEEQAKIRFHFPPGTQSGKEVISLKNVGVRFGEKKVLEKIHWSLPRGARVAITGVNGAGKTTLLRLLSGDLKPSEGEVKLGHNVQLGYYAQLQSEVLDRNKTILEELEETAPHLPVSQVRGIAGAFLFQGDSVLKKCGVLSGGEKARVALAKLLLSPSNFLILDEPTNHLDVESEEVLRDALKDYHGTVCIVSHDRDFMAPLVTSVIEIQKKSESQPSELVQFLGSYEDYVQKKAQEVAQQGEQNRRSVNSASSGDSTNLSGSQNSSGDSRAARKAQDREARSRKRQQETLEAEIVKLEERKDEVDRLLALDSTLQSPSEIARLSKERQSIENTLEEKMVEWEKVSF